MVGEDLVQRGRGQSRPERTCHAPGRAAAGWVVTGGVPRHGEVAQSGTVGRGGVGEEVVCTQDAHDRRRQRVTAERGAHGVLGHGRGVQAVERSGVVAEVLPAGSPKCPAWALTWWAR